MAFELPALPYDKTALEPHISAETLDFHHGKHHATYVTKLNGLIEGTDLAGKSLEEIVRNSDGGVFNNAAQIWNHTFYWNSLSPNGGGEPSGALAEAINAKWGSFADFKAAFNDKAVNNFGSSWTWLIKAADGSLDIMNTSNANNPITSDGVSALLVVDLWEHAYYIDYRNVRPNYLEGFWALANWQFASENFTG
ncbi:superoxide dismutase [Fe] [Glaciecola punicea ACAM 611]|jgi:Fe-Mn family superoxide dismutase|uniref:Superoxide dismutase n=1 Tax=Glaciecola punicea ACAM 611 TaxID=1121923 RepID=H5T8P4_9ALTE|nr:Fe-Mn family superoxide dismutase [Glaciecola punicea]GAB54671.1 superoxide dismutase [Fe] [Glaciecola punicea ACAM 611]